MPTIAKNQMNFKISSSPQHNGQNLSCSAQVTTLENSEIETSQVLIVHRKKHIIYFLLLDTHFTDISKVYLSLGKPLEKSQVKVGGDIYLDCDANAYPPPQNIIWMKDVRLQIKFLI